MANDFDADTQALLQLPREKRRELLLAELSRRSEQQAARWEPQEGPQKDFVNSTVKDAFFGGGVGSGKTAALLFDFRDHADLYKDNAHGIIFRRSHPELEEVLKISRQMYYPEGWTWRAGERQWISNHGATLKLRHLENEDDVSKYQGQSWTWLGADEIGNYSTLDYFDMLRARLRSTAGVPTYFRCTGNPGGPGHTLLKARYVDPAPYGEVFIGEDGIQRCYFHSTVKNNPMLLENDPEYVERIMASGPDWLVRAWLEGDWNVVAGSFLEGVWNPDIHVIEPFTIPDEWKRFRSLDWGYAAPYSVGWWAVDHDGVLYRYRELYGDGGKPNTGTREDVTEVARKILKMEEAEAARGIRFRNNPADTGIWTSTGQSHRCIADQFRECGVIWNKAAKGPGSRVQGCQEIVSRLTAERLKVFSTCHQAIKFLPSMVPDKDNPEDVDDGCEDHCVSGCVALHFDGDRVWSHGKWRKFYNLRCTQRNARVVKVTFSDGYSLRCTPEHLFLTSSGWLQAKELEGKSLPLSPAPNRFSEDLLTIRAATTSKGHAAVMGNGSAFDFIKQCGYRISEKYRSVITSITRTKTFITTTLQTLTVYQSASTACTTSPSAGVPRPRSGTEVRKVENGTASITSGTSGTSWNRWLTQSARCAVKHIRLRRFFSAGRNTVADAVERVHCVRVEPAGFEDVYCMRVPSVAAFDLQNGVVVANCWDEVRYAVLSRRSASERARAMQKHKPGTFAWLLDLPKPNAEPPRRYWQLR